MNLAFPKIVHALALLAMVVTSCGRGSYNSQLVLVDSLLNATQYEQADSLLKLCDPSNYSTQDRAYHALLRTQCDYKNYIVATTDSAINLAVEYFEKSGDKEKYTRSLIYQGCANEELGNLEKAVECYHKADDIADKDDLYNKAFAKMRLGLLYQSQKAFAKMRLGLLYQSQFFGAKKLSVEKYAEALRLFEKIGNEHYEIICLTEIGGLYSFESGKEDSAIWYMDKAIKLAQENNEPSHVFNNLVSKSLYYLNTTKEYQKSKYNALLSLKLNENNLPMPYMILARVYAYEDNVDSARYYITNCPPVTKYVDSVSYYMSLSELCKAKGDNEGYWSNYKQSETIADSIMHNSLNDRLRAVEKKYDTQQAELENAKLSLELRNTLLTLAAIVIGALALLLLVLRYRHRLREKESEYELLKADLDTSLSSLENMKSTVAQLESEHDNSNNTELKNILEEQIGAVHQLMKWSYELSSDAFVKKFNSLMTMPSGKEQESFWNNLHTITNELHDNVLTRAQEAAGGTLRDDELNYLALYCCGFSRSVIMTCMHYKSLGTVSNKKIQIAQKLNVPNLDHFVHN